MLILICYRKNTGICTLLTIFSFILTPAKDITSEIREIKLMTEKDIHLRFQDTNN